MSRFVSLRNRTQVANYLLLTLPNVPVPKFFENRYWPILISFVDIIYLLKNA